MRLKRHELQTILEKRTNLIGHEGSGEEFWMSFDEDYRNKDDKDRGVEFGFSLYDVQWIKMTIQISNYDDYVKNMVDGSKKGLPNHNSFNGGFLKFRFSHKQVDMMVDMVNQFEGLTFLRDENYFPYPQLTKKD